MARFLVKASEFKNVCKAVNDRKLAELKKEIIEILKKQDEKEVKKAIDYFESQELHYTHLEKSFNGKWVEKAGYGVGTVRIWKGKKYKKIAPGKWARVFEKEGRGTNIAIGKLIAKVQKIDNVEDLMAFVMANKQRFVDENGVDLPVLDKLRAAVDARNGNVGSKEKTVEDKIKENPDYPFKPKTDKERAERAAFEKDRDDFIERMDKIRQENKKKDSKPAEKYDDDKAYKEYQKLLMKENPTDADNERLGELVTEHYKHSKKEWIGGKGLKELNAAKDEDDVLSNGKTVKEVREQYGIESKKPAEKKGEVDDYKKQLEDVVKEELVNQKEDVARLYDKGTKGYAVGMDLTDKDKNTSVEDRIQEAAEWLVEHPKGNPKSIGKMLARVELAKEFEKKNNEKEKPAEKKEESETYWIQDNRGNRLTNKDAKKRLMADIENLKEYKNEYLLDRLNPEDRKEIESEFEKTKNRSDAMKGNQNARKYGLTDEQIERYDIQEVVEDVNGYGIVKNSEGKYSYIDDGRVKDRPDDFETSIEKVKERINDTYETKKNIQAAKNYDFKNAKLGSDVQYTKKNNGNHLYFKKSPDGSKVLSVTVNVSDMREPLNMVYEVSDTKTGESWQYETAYGNKEGLEWAVERPEQMEKEIKKFFKRDPNKEWEKQNTFEKEAVIDRSFSTNNPEKLKPIAKSESIGEGEVKMPYSKEVSDEIKMLTNTAKDALKRGSNYAFLNKVYYDKGNLVSTDGYKMKIVKVGELDGIDNGSFVDIDNSKDGVTITVDKEFTKEHKFPQYERVLPHDNNEKIVLDNKALIAKIKDLKKDGSITNKDSFVTFDIKGNDLMLDGVKVGDVSAAKFEGEDSDFFNMDANFLADYISGDYSELMSSKDTGKAMYIGNGSAINVLMPQTKYDYSRDSNGKEIKEIRRKNYESMRKEKEKNDKYKAEAKEQRFASNKDFVEDIINGYKRSVKDDFEEKSINKLQEWTVEQLERMYKVANADIDHLMDIKDLNSNAFASYTEKNYSMSPRHLIGQNYAMKEHPAIVRELERLIKEKGGKVEKSILDDFLIDIVLDTDETDVEKDKENESLWNDYSAEQPELFNSTEMMVREAFNRCRVL